MERLNVFKKQKIKAVILLEADGRITAEQATAYKEYHAKQKTSQTVAD